MRLPALSILCLAFALAVPTPALAARSSEARVLDAAAAGNVGALAVALGTPANLQARDRHGRTALHLALARGADPALAILLIAHGADPNALDGEGHTPLFLALSGAMGDPNSHPGVVQALVTAGAKVRTVYPDMLGATPLIMAAMAGSVDLVGILLRAEAPVDDRDSLGATALMYAAVAGRTEVVSMLLDAGASVNASDKAGNTPLRVARADGKAAIADQLLRAGARP